MGTQNSTETVSLEWMSFTSEALSYWGLDDATTKLLSLSENATYLVNAPSGDKYVLRMHRPNYRSATQIASEMEWLEYIGADGKVATAGIIPTLEGEKYCTFVNELGETQIADLMEFVDGEEPLHVGMLEVAQWIGGIAAQLHRLALTWKAPEGFDRITWDENRMLGENSDYGDWRNCTGLSEDMIDVMAQAEAKALQEIADYGKSVQNFGLVHTDLRSSNLLITADGTINVLDFDDCGWGWFMFDVATSFTFEDMKPDFEDNLLSYLRGYRTNGGILPDKDFQYLPAMLVARRLNMVAWMECRKETPFCQEIHEEFVAGSYDMARAYVDGTFMKSFIEAAQAEKLTALVFGR